MIYIFDNGRSYSDHRVYFIEPTAEEQPYLEELFKAYARAWPRLKDFENGYLIARVEKAEFFVSRIAMDDFIEALGYTCNSSCADIEAAKQVHTLAGMLAPNEWWTPGFELDPDYLKCSKASR